MALQSPTYVSSKPVPIFKAGTYDSGTFDRDFLQSVVDNYNRYQRGQLNDSPYPRPPLVDLGTTVPHPSIGIGHEPDQAYLKQLLERTDLPSAGWPTQLYLDGDTLYATFESMPEPVASLVNSDRLPTCSAEFYRDYEGLGPMLRRVALMGGDIPKVKGLQIPVMVYSERPNSQIVFYFSERNSMDRQALLAALAEHGVDTASITDAVPDALLQSMVDALQAAKAGGSMPSQSDVSNVSMNAESMDYNDHDMDNMPKMNEGNMPNMTKTPADKRMEAFAERLIRRLLPQQLAPIAQSIKALKQTVGGVQSKIQTANKDKDRQEVVEFCERLRSQGKINPSQLDPRQGKTIIDMLMELDNTAPIVKFSEQHKAVTQRRAFMLQLERSPVIKTFGERIAQPVQQAGAVDPKRIEYLKSLSPVLRATQKA